MSWWNTNYLFRRNVQLITLDAVPAGCPVDFTFSSNITASGKTLDSRSDIEVVYYDGIDWIPIPSVTNLTGNTLTAGFNLYTALPANQTISGQYYIYYGNHNPPSHPIVGPLVTNLFPIEITADNYAITYTNPGEDWVEGHTAVQGAKATFHFTGEQVEVVANTGPRCGTVSIQLDNNPPEEVSLFNSSDKRRAIYTSPILDTFIHVIRVVNLNKRSPGALDSAVNIASIYYAPYIGAFDLGEEIIDMSWSAAIGGSS